MLLLYSCDGFYPLIARINYLTKFTAKARESWLEEFELAENDVEDTLTKDISTCFKTETINGATVKTPTNALGRVCKKLLAKAKHSVFVSLHSPLEALPSLLPANIDIGIQFCKLKRNQAENKENCSTSTSLYFFYFF